MPYPNEHAARVKEPGEFEKDSMRTKPLGKGVSIIIGKIGNSMVAQSYRFSADKYTAEEAKKWLDDNKIKYESFEAATGKALDYETLKSGARNSQTDLERLQEIHDLAVENGASCMTEKAMSFNALKAVSMSDDELVVSNKIVVFGGRDLTGFIYAKNKNGSSGEYFTKETDLESDYTKTGRLLIDFEHGSDPDRVGIGRDDILGYVDWGSAKSTDSGVFVNRVLNRRNKYVKMLEPLIKEGLIGNSSEAALGGIQKSADGKIIKWPLVRDTLTVMPMEPRMLTQNALTALKAIGETELKSLIPESMALTDSDKKDNHSKGVTKMDELELQETIIKSVNAALEARDNTAKAEVEKQAALKAAEDEGYKKAVEEMKKKNIGYIPEGQLGDDNDGVQAFKAWVQTGQHNSSLIDPRKDVAWAGTKAAFNITTGESGSYLVPDPLYQTIQAKRSLASWVRQAPVQHFTTPADHLLVPAEATAMTAFTQTAEGVAYTENEATVSQVDLILYKYTKVVKMSEEFVSFNGTNFDAWLTNRLAQAEAVTENSIFTTGTGSGAPQGVVTGASAGNTVTTSAVLVPGDFTALIGKLGKGYNVQGQCGFLMPNATNWYAKGISTTGFFAFIKPGENGSGLDQGFLGYPAFTSDDMDAYTSTTGKPMLFGNFNYYGVVEKPGLMLQRNPYLYMATGQIGLFATMYRGGAVLQSEAFYYAQGK